MAKKRTSAPPNPFKKRLLVGEPLIGVWSSLASHLAAEMISHSDFDWALFDGEHAPNEVAHMVNYLQAMRGSSVAPMVRPAWNDQVLLKRLLDIGFQNFVVPYVQNADEARAAVAATRYPPQGIRGVAMAMRAADYGFATNYVQTANATMCVIVQVETEAAVADLDNICAVRGVDAVFVGPSDLAASLGHLGDSSHKDVQKVIRRVADTCARHGTTSGILARNVKEVEKYLKWGFRFIGATSDTALLKAGMTGITDHFSK
jgi:4-hydroxy-2-oxoheptanedioate aldolase